MGDVSIDHFAALANSKMNFSFSDQFSLANLSDSNFSDFETVQKEYIFDRQDVRIIFIILYSIVFCCCFFGECSCLYAIEYIAYCIALMT